MTETRAGKPKGISMRYHVLATDYDGTIATDGVLDAPTVDALRKLLATGRKLVLVTGRELTDLQRVCPHLELFQLVVAENGALLYRPSNKTQTVLADAPPAGFVAELERRGVTPLSTGASIVATWEPHSQTVLDTIRDLGLELQLIFNKGAVMVVPAGVNKATGLTAALDELHLSPRNVVGVGDAENDHSFLKLCELSAAVANALPAVKDAVDIVTKGDHGAGVAQLAAALIENDLAGPQRPERRSLEFGTSDGEPIALPSFGSCVLICGPSASGKSTIAKRIVESIRDCGYQFCLVDPEGDYEALSGAVVIGKADAAPTIDEAMQLLEDVGVNGVVSLTATKLSDRPSFFVELLARLLQMRTRYGRPHWLVIDEVHHVMPAEWQPPKDLLPEKLESVLMITVHPELLSLEILKRVTHVIAVGNTARDTLARIAEVRGIDIATGADVPEKHGEALLWSADDGSVRLIETLEPKEEHRRHSRKYAEGNLSPKRSFYFRGEHGKLNLRAKNLIQFLELAEGVDDETWAYHFRLGDYSRWFRDAINDEELAAEAERVERLGNAAKAKTLPLLRTAIESRYTLPAAAPIAIPGTRE